VGFSQLTHNTAHQHLSTEWPTDVHIFSLGALCTICSSVHGEIDATAQIVLVRALFRMYTCSVLCSQKSLQSMILNDLQKARSRQKFMSGEFTIIVKHMYVLAHKNHRDVDNNTSMETTKLF